MIAINFFALTSSEEAIKVVNGPDEAYTTAKQIMGMQLVTHQIGPEGKEVKRLLVWPWRPWILSSFLVVTRQIFWMLGAVPMLKE